ncbi:hypothetical protein M0804_000063 [Polistes exclamans]|nr:hypothetical protein M0804_000063 [Polistes exclamans]
MTESIGGGDGCGGIPAAAAAAAVTWIYLRLMFAQSKPVFSSPRWYPCKHEYAIAFSNFYLSNRNNALPKGGSISFLA